MCVRVQKYLMENFLSFSSNKTKTALHRYQTFRSDMK